MITRLTPIQKMAVLFVVVALIAGCSSNGELTCYGYCTVGPDTVLEQEK